MKKYLLLIMLIPVLCFAADKQSVTIKEYDAAIKEYPAEKIAIYDSVKKELTFDTNVSSREKSWRLVHDGKKVLDLFECEGYTGTINTLFEAKTKEECETEIKRLNLTPLSGDELEPEVVKTEDVEIITEKIK